MERIQIEPAAQSASDLYDIMATLDDERFKPMPIGSTLYYRARLNEALCHGDINIDVYLGRSDGCLYVTVMDGNEPWREMCREMMTSTTAEHAARWLGEVLESLRYNAAQGHISKWGGYSAAGTKNDFHS